MTRISSYCKVSSYFFKNMNSECMEDPQGERMEIDLYRSFLERGGKGTCTMFIKGQKEGLVNMRIGMRQLREKAFSLIHFSDTENNEYISVEDLKKYIRVRLQTLKRRNYLLNFSREQVSDIQSFSKKEIIALIHTEKQKAAQKTLTEEELKIWDNSVSILLKEYAERCTPLFLREGESEGLRTYAIYGDSNNILGAIPPQRTYESTPTNTIPPIW